MVKDIYCFFVLFLLETDLYPLKIYPNYDFSLSFFSVPPDSSSSPLPSGFTHFLSFIRKQATKDNTKVERDIRRQKVVKHCGKDKTNKQKRAQVKAGETIRDAKLPSFTHSEIP